MMTLARHVLLRCEVMVERIFLPSMPLSMQFRSVLANFCRHYNNCFGFIIIIKLFYSHYADS